MNPFQAWYLPLPFSLGSDEIRVPDEERDSSFGGGLRYPVLADEKFREVILSLRVAGERVLLERSVESIVEILGQVANRFLDSRDDLRTAAVEQVRLHAAYSHEMASEVVTGMARGWTGKSLGELVAHEFPDPSVLDGFQAVRSGRRLRAVGHRLAVHIGAGTVPGVSVTSMIRSLLVKSPVLLKPGRADVVLPVLFARALAEVDPELGRCVAVLYWPGHLPSLTDRVLAQADLVVGYGTDETLTQLRSRLPLDVPFVGYRHRIGIGLVGRCLSKGDRRAAAEEAARAVAVFDQKGCVSPHLFFVESETEEGAERWATELAGAFARMEDQLPSGSLTPEEGSGLEQVRGLLEVKEAAGSGRVIHGGRVAPWTVAFDPGGTVGPSCLSRTVRVVPVRDLRDSLPHLEAWKGYLQTVGVARLGENQKEPLAEALARLGVTRIVPLQEVPWPDPWWHHDGSGPLEVLVRWTDWKG